MLTPVSVDNFSAVYTTLPTGLGLQLGMVVQSPNDNHYRMLVQNVSGGSLTAAAGDAMVWSVALNYTVTTSSAIQQMVVGLNDLSGQAVANMAYFWVTIRGRGKVKTTGTPASGTILVTTATAGTLGAVSTNVTQTTIVATAATSAGTNTIWMY